MSKLFDLAPRPRDTVEINGEPVAVCALDLDARTRFFETREKTLGYQMAWIAAQGTPDLAGCSPEDVLQNLHFDAISNLAARIMQLSGMGAAEQAMGKRSGKTRT